MISGKLKTKEKVVAVLQASLVEEWVKSSCFLALVEHLNEHGFFVFSSIVGKPQYPADLELSKVFPIDLEFRITEEPRTDGEVELFFRVISSSETLLFEASDSNVANTFLQDVKRVVENYSRFRSSSPKDFDWISDYVAIVLAAENTTSKASTVLKDKMPVVQATEDKTDLAEAERYTDHSDLLRQGSYGTASDDVGLPEVDRIAIAMGGKRPVGARDSVVRYQMVMKEEAYTDLDHLRVFCGTWNVNGQSPENVPLSSWLAKDPDPPDIYAVGFQELDLSKEAFIFDDTPKEEEWTMAVINGLHSRAKYRKIRQVRLVGMLLFVFVQEKHLAYIRNVAVVTVGTGIMGKMGNKGAVAIRLDIHSTSICFINSHLAAHQLETERRNRDYRDITFRLCFQNFLPPKTIKDHDLIFWLGDLNYRLDNIDQDQLMRMIKDEAWEKMYLHDQLEAQKQTKKAFFGYEEGKIMFKPSYKYNPGTDTFNYSGGTRSPAWCDRVLWRGGPISLVEYRGHEEPNLSDHRPVSASFKVGIKVINLERYQKTYEEVMKKLDKLENEFLPQVSVDKLEIAFDTVRFLEVQTQTLVIANTGQVPVRFEFIRKLNEPSFCKPWLKIQPFCDFIKPGEKCDVELEVFVDKKTVAILNSGREQFYDILVLHLEDGKDLFITVKGEYQRTCFGLSLNTLVQLREPIKDVSPGKIVEMEKRAGTEPIGSGYGVPKEIWFLVDHLYRRGLETDGLFQTPGHRSEILAIRDSLDAGVPEDELPGSIHSLAEALLIFLESMPDSVIPTSFYIKAIDASPNYMLCQQLVNQLPDHHKNLFVYLCAFLKETLLKAEQNGLDAKTLAMLFGGIFLREPESTISSGLDARSGVAKLGATGPTAKGQVEARRRASFVYHFLVTDSWTD
ncbi:unnamed protein product [Cyprideis torosa]|uniref:phosphoinositide 5-phosphatase n=1 Tax=Cyprideis torosa TaxID=163714 RepID=A0A7R8W190_9CRUS|nr:unnamed protein product [Cyprideis torosa]CAG0879555.1 unnamed protein product [Cyprideis torosa]